MAVKRREKDIVVQEENEKNIIKEEDNEMNLDIVENEDIITQNPSMDLDYEEDLFEDIQDENIDDLENEDLNDEFDNLKNPVRMNGNQSLKEILEVNPSLIIPAKSRATEKPFGKSGVITVVDGGKCGRRVVISNELCQKLGLEDLVQFTFIPGKMLVGKSTPGQTYSFQLKKQGAKHIVYSANLVREITDNMGLEFKESKKTTKTFYSVDYDYSYDDPIAIIN